MDWLAEQWTRLDAIAVDLPAVFGPILIICLALAGAIIVHALIFRQLMSWAEGHTGARRMLVVQGRRPARLLMLLTALLLVAPQVRLRDPIDDAVRHIVLIALLILIGWTLILLSNTLSERSLSRNHLDDEDNLVARKRATQVGVLRRSFNILVVIFTVAAVLLTFESVRSYGVSIFASAGAAGLIIGLAARPVLANLIAGIQIAITQPIRLEDVVIVDGEWGWVEEIASTYVVVRIWDLRRMVVPLSYFIEKPFQNWTRENATIIGSVFWHVDYTVPVERVREVMTEYVQESAYWDGKVVNLQVTDTDKDTVTLRGLMSARTSPQAWDLRCEIRERVLEWLQAEHPEALPRLRAELNLPDGNSDDERAASTMAGTPDAGARSDPIAQRRTG